MTEPTHHRVAKSAEAIWSTPRRCGRRRRCDGHLRYDRHMIEVGDWIVWSALPPDSKIGNLGWWHMAFCADCAPEPVIETTDTAADGDQP